MNKNETYGYCTLCRQSSHLVKIIGLADTGSTGYYCSDCIYESISRSFNLDFCQECKVAVVVEDMTYYPNDTATIDQKLICPECFGKHLHEEVIYNTTLNINKSANKALKEIDELIGGDRDDIG